MCDQRDQRPVDEGRETQGARDEDELRVLLERAVPRLPAPEGRLSQVRERVGRIRRRRRATGAAALTVTGLVLAGTFLPGALRGSGPESEPVPPAAPAPSTTSRAVAHDGLVQFRNVAGLILRLPKGWQALETPPGSGYDETPERVASPGTSSTPPGNLSAPSEEATTASRDRGTALPSDGVRPSEEVRPSDGVRPADGMSPVDGVRPVDTATDGAFGSASRATAVGFASSQSLTSDARTCAGGSGTMCLPVSELRRGAALLVLVPRAEYERPGRIEDSPALRMEAEPSKICRSIRGTTEYSGLVGGGSAPHKAVAVSLCISGDAPWTAEAVSSMLAGADFDKDPGEDSREGAEPVPVPAAEHLRDKTAEHLRNKK
ncbi:hypothetical protein ACIOJD_22620 [Streptomyces sp. NPDC088116]|uniref:hypothetical protein n=1 Tax=Streptomyces sp. NPDC088116 TaxID=3365825 RepID=UPI003817620D